MYTYRLTKFAMTAGIPRPAGTRDTVKFVGASALVQTGRAKAHVQIWRNKQVQYCIRSPWGRVQTSSVAHHTFILEFGFMESDVRIVLCRILLNYDTYPRQPTSTLVNYDDIW